MGVFTVVTSTMGEADAFFRWLRTCLATGDTVIFCEPERVRTANVMRGTGVGVAAKYESRDTRILLELCVLKICSALVSNCNALVLTP
jgi:hypothetical protein